MFFAILQPQLFSLWYGCSGYEVLRTVAEAEYVSLERYSVTSQVLLWFRGTSVPVYTYPFLLLL